MPDTRVLELSRNTDGDLILQLSEDLVTFFTFIQK